MTRKSVSRLEYLSKRTSRDMWSPGRQAEHMRAHAQADNRGGNRRFSLEGEARETLDEVEEDEEESVPCLRGAY